MMRSIIHIKVSSLTPVEFKEDKKQNNSTVFNAMFIGQPRPETLPQTNGHTNPPTTPVRPLGQPRTTVQCRIQTQFPTTAVCVQYQPVQRNYITHYGYTVKPPNRLTQEM